MELHVRNGPFFATAEVLLDPGDVIVAESGSMVLRDTAIDAEATMRASGGVTAMFRRAAAGESFFLTRFSAGQRQGRLVLAPALPGDLAWLPMPRANLILQSGAFVAAEPSVTVDAKWGGAKGFFSGMGLTLLRAHGRGHILFGGFGGMQCIDVDGEFYVDNGHVIAFEDTLSWKMTRFGKSWWTFLAGGEGVVCQFKGTGRLWISNRNAWAYGVLLGSRLPPQ